MKHQGTSPLTEQERQQQELLAKALKKIPEKPEESLRHKWPEGYDLYDALCKLRNILDAPGRFLYSDISTLREGNFYLLGHNPDVDLNENPKLSDEIRKWSAKSKNAFLDESWENRPDGEYTIQKRVQELCKYVVDKDLDLDTSTRQVCASNLFFGRSKSATTLAERDPESFWPVHRAVLDIVQPVCILAIGAGKNKDNTYRIVKDLLGFSDIKDIIFPSGHENCSCFVVEGHYQSKRLNQQIKLIGVPDFSRFVLDIQALEWIAKECRKSVTKSRRNASKHP